MTTRGKITIVGAGQSGLALAFGLLRYDYSVTVISDRTPEDLLYGRVTSSQCMFDSAQGFERALGINFWDAECPNINGVRISGYLPDHPDSPVTSWAAPLDRPAQSIDQRLKFSRWMKAFEELGGDLQFVVADVDLLERQAQESDLVVVAAGKGSISNLFDRDDQKSTFSSPQRSLAMFYVDGLEARSESFVEFNAIPEVGEYLTYPALTRQGDCQIMLFEAIPAGPMDIWTSAASDSDCLARAHAVLRKYLPSEAVRARSVSLIDGGATLVGAFTPTVRHPVGTLPSGAHVLGMGDVLVLNDPITAQGANNANKFAETYLHAITHHSGRFDREFMQQTFTDFWRSIGEVSTAFTTQFLGPSPDHARQLHMAAGRYPEIGRRMAACMNDPNEARGFVLDPVGAYRFIDDVARKSAQEATLVSA